jgi:hypothetical protein
VAQEIAGNHLGSNIDADGSSQKDHQYEVDPLSWFFRTLMLLANLLPFWG